MSIEHLSEMNPALGFELALGRKSSSTYCDNPFDLSDDPYCFLHGAYPPSLFRVFKWLREDKKRQLYILDDDWTLFLANDECKSWLKEGRIHCFGEGDGHYNRLAWHTLFKPCQWIGVKSNSESVQKALFDTKTGVELSFADFKEFGLPIFSNVAANLTGKKQLNLLEPMKNSLKGEPAVICGAGPSLLECDLASYKDCAYFFGGARAQEMLKEIPLDFGGIIDPTYVGNQTFNSSQCTFFQARAAHDMVRSCQSPLIWSGCGDGYTLEHYFYRQLGIDFTLEGGWNVSTFLTLVALYLGCSPIIFAGQDMCYREGEKYAQKVKHKDNMPLIDIQDEKGNWVQTKRDFLMAKQWIEEIISHTPNTPFYKWGEGGLPIEGAKAIDTMQLKRFNKTNVPIHSHAIHFETQTLCQSLQNALVLVLKLIQELKNMLHHWQKNQKKSFNSTFTLIEVELKEEICYTHLLRPLWNMWRYTLLPQDIKEDQPFNLQEIQGKTYEFLFYQDVIQQWMSTLTKPSSSSLTKN